MKNKRRKLAAAAVLCLFLLMFGGCSVGGTKIFFASGCGPGQVFKIGSMGCSQEEAKVYLMNYKNLYGVVYDTDLWNGEFDTQTMEESLKDAVMDRLTRVYTLNLYAKEQEIVLSDAEEEAAKDAAKEYYESLSREERSYSGASERDVEEMYQRCLLAQKVYTQLMGSVDEEISEDEARVMDANIIFVTDEAAADQVAAQLSAEASFSSLASTYNEADQSSVSFGRGTYPQEMEDVAFALENDAVSGKITTSDGYYFVQCVNKYNQELSETNKAQIIAARQQQTLEDILTSLEENYYSELNQGLWDRITLEDGADLKTDSFFQVIASHTEKLS